MRKMLFIVAGALGMPGLLQSQVTGGTARYEVRLASGNVSISENGAAKLPPEVLVQMQAQVAAASQSFELVFDAGKALYQKAHDQKQGGGAFEIKMSGNDEVVFDDFNARTSVTRYEISGDYYIVADSLKKWPWQLQDETKMIGEYLCHKATLPADDISVITNGVEKKTKGREIVAWYTLDIPIPAGPSRFHGLPGLILRVEDNMRTISFAGFSPNVRTEVAPPTTGKKVTPEEFRNLQRQLFDRMKATAPSKNSGIVIETVPQH